MGLKTVHKCIVLVYYFVHTLISKFVIIINYHKKIWHHIIKMNKQSIYKLGLINIVVPGVVIFL